MNLIVIGGNPAGLSAASGARRAHPDWEIVVFERGGYVSYGSCGLPYYSYDLVPSKNKLITLTPQVLQEKRNIPVKLFHEVTSIDFTKKTVIVQDITNHNKKQANYDYLVIAVGAKPKRLPIEHPNIFYIHTIPDADRIKTKVRQNVESGHFQSGVIIGSGYIGLEMAEVYRELGIDNLTIIGPRLLYRSKSQQFIRDELEKHGVKVISGQYIKEIAPVDDTTLKVQLEDGSSIPTNFVHVSIGVMPNTSFLQGSPLNMDEKTGAIIVDEFMRTNIEAVYAAGDCVTSYHRLLNNHVYVPLAPAANKQGRVAGKMLAARGDTSKVLPFPGIVGTSLWKVFDLYCGKTGLEKHQAEALGYEVGSTLITTNEIAHYYPNTRGKFEEKMSLLLLFDVKSHELLGAEITSPQPIGAKKIDVLATALYGNMTIDDLQQLDLGYQPAFSPVWDPINVAANVAGKKLK